MGIKKKLILSLPPYTGVPKIAGNNKTISDTLHMLQNRK